MDALKTKWNHENFDAMNWHDCKIYAVCFDSENFELSFDIDYIIQWIKDKAPKGKFRFKLVPATLVFKNVHSIEIASDNIELIILSVVREALGKPANGDIIKASIEYLWTIETTVGEIAFKSIGYEQFARGEAVELGAQSIGLKERNGVSFGRG